MHNPFLRSLSLDRIGARHGTASHQAPASLAAEIGAYSGAWDVSADADFDYWRLTSSGTLTVTKAGYVQTQWIGSGGSGGGAFWTAAGGGGAGELYPADGGSALIWLEAGAHAITVGDGGSPSLGGSARPPSLKGTDTVAFGRTARAGGVGLTQLAVGEVADGACGGGGYNGLAGTFGDIGGDGGRGFGGSNITGGGGGGMAGNGADGDDVDLSRGGAGVETLFFGFAETVCEGGSGGRRTDVPLPPTGGTGGQGGYDGSQDGGAAVPGSGSGGGGGTRAATNSGAGGQGASGRVGLRVPKSGFFGIDLDEAPVDGFVYPLDAGLTAAEVGITGTFAGHGGAVEARVVDANGAGVLDWQPVARMGADVSDTLSLPVDHAGRMMRFEIRTASDPGQVWRQTRLWTIGVHVAFVGQSNTAFFGATGTEAVTGRSLIHDAETGSYLQSSGAGVVAFANTFEALTGLPAMCVFRGVGGTFSGYWSNVVNPGPADMLAALTASGARLHHMQVHQGEAEASGTGITDVLYASNWTTFRRAAEMATNQSADDFSVGFSSLGFTTRDDFADMAGQADIWAGVDAIHDGISGLMPNAYFSGSWRDAVLLDTYHGYAESYARRGAREAYALAFQRGLVATDPEFVISGASIASDSQTVVIVTHGMGSDIEIVSLPHAGGSGDVTVTATTQGAFEVSADGGATWIPTTGVRGSPTTVDLSHAPIGTGARLVRYNQPLSSGSDGLVRDTSPYNWPLMHATNVAAV